MWDNIINIHPIELLSTKTKESKINYCKKKKSASQITKSRSNKKIKINMGSLHFIPNNILTRLFKELTKCNNDY